MLTENCPQEEELVLLHMLVVVPLDPQPLMNYSLTLKSMESSLIFGRKRKLYPANFNLGWYRFYGFQFPNLLEGQGLLHLVEQKGCIYSDLICVFYFNLHVPDGVATTKVKGVNIILDDDIWANVAMMPIKDDVVKVHLGEEGFNRLLPFPIFVKESTTPTRA